MAQLLECSFERSVYHKIRVFEAERVKELYARMLQTSQVSYDLEMELLHKPPPIEIGAVKMIRTEIPN